MASNTEFVPNSVKFLEMYHAVNFGKLCSPRGQDIREVEDYTLILDPSDSCMTSFRARKFNLKYAIQEFLWYLRADKFDVSIEEHATMWPKIKQPGGFYYSNYGQYMFNVPGVHWVINELKRDKDSRRAAFPFLRDEHCFANNKDMVCTYAMSFRIRDNRLNMSVSMRSNDAIFGTTNDVFCFWLTYQLVYAILKAHYPELKMGRYVHKVDSLHVYERHWLMLATILTDGKLGYMYSDMPRPDGFEAMDWLANKRPTGRFSTWLIQNS